MRRRRSCCCTRGSARVGVWGSFPDELAAATGAGVFVYSRAGYGQSSPVKLPRPVSFMHDEAREVLPRVLDAIGFRRGLLVGHSDGASIAAIYAGSIQDHRVRGLVLMAPHFFTEDMGIAEIARAKAAFEQGHLRAKLARCTPMSTTRSTAGAAPGSIPSSASGTSRDALAYIRVPMLIVQGEDDQYGTVRQIEVAQAGMLLPGRGRAAAGYAPRAAPRSAGGDLARDRRVRQPAAARPPRRRSCRCDPSARSPRIAIVQLSWLDERETRWPMQSAN